MKFLYTKSTSQLAVARCHYLLLLLAIGLSSCQHSAYSFQRVVKPEHPTLMATSATTSALVVAPAKQPLSAIDPITQPQYRVKRRARLLSRAAHMVSTSQVPRVVALATRAKVVAQSQQDPLPPSEPAHGRSRGVAFLLAFLVGGLGLHLFYLGYHGRGMAYLLTSLAAIVLFTIGAAGLIASLFGGGGSGFVALLVIGGLLASLVGTLALIDAVLIITDGLKPRDGEYYPKFFQTRPRADTSTN
jgi:TM2 domain-containing membrane protein YozV